MRQKTLNVNISLRKFTQESAKNGADIRLRLSDSDRQTSYRSHAAKRSKYHQFAGRETRSRSPFSANKIRSRAFFARKLR